jgi:hypothetical protein
LVAVSASGKLATPGTFFNDPVVRIGLLMIANLGGGGLGGGFLAQALGAGAKPGLTDGLERQLNDAADLAAQAANPVFRAAITRISLIDVPGIATQNDGATLYRQTSANSEQRRKLRPPIDTALGKVGADRALDRLGRSN